MEAYWIEEEEARPCQLANKNNAAVLEADADGRADSTARASHFFNKGGAVKLAELVGAFLNHKDKKKG